MTDLDARAFVRRGNTLVPADTMADEVLGEIPEGREVLVTIRRARNPKHHRLLFAMLRKVTDNSDDWQDEQELLDDLKIATGHATLRRNLLTGEAHLIPRSISYASMDQIRFNRWFNRAVFVLATKVLRNLPDDLHREILEMAEGLRKAA